MILCSCPYLGFAASPVVQLLQNPAHHLLQKLRRTAQKQSSPEINRKAFLVKIQNANKQKDPLWQEGIFSFGNAASVSGVVA